MKILVAGSSGFVGSALVEVLRARGDEVIKLVRRTHVAEDEIAWNPTAHEPRIDRASIEGFDAVVHLGGVGIGERRWTDKHKQRLWDSRVVSTELLCKAIATLDHKPRALVCASAVGYYGSRGDEVLSETSGKGDGFLADLCENWELITHLAADAGVRVANLRTGIVLGHGGGVLRQQIPLFRLGLGGVMGSGRQFTSWISLIDEVDAIVHVIDNPISGPVNLVSPNPERNSVYTKVMGHFLRRPTFIPVPRWMMTVPLGDEFSDEVLLASQRAKPDVLSSTGFEFTHTHLEQALDQFLIDEAKANNKNKSDAPKDDE